MPATFWLNPKYQAGMPKSVAGIPKRAAGMARNGWPACSVRELSTPVAMG
jgi:hypothetical protein